MHDGAPDSASTPQPPPATPISFPNLILNICATLLLIPFSNLTTTLHMNSFRKTTAPGKQQRSAWTGSMRSHHQLRAANATNDTVDQTNRTTLSGLFESVDLRIDENPDRPANPDTACHYAEDIISTVVADGLSRIGAQAQWDNPASITNFRVPGSSLKAFLSGLKDNPSYTVPCPAGVSAQNQMQMTWYTTVSGLAYKADNTAAQLALALLFACLLVALIHTAVVVWSSWSIVPWKSSTELMVLAQQSPPSKKTLADIAPESTRKGHGNQRSGYELSEMARERWTKRGCIYYLMIPVTRCTKIWRADACMGE